jgi:hypothetical protein
MILKAKPIIKNQYWVVTDGNHKIGNVEASGNGYDFRSIDGTITHFDDTKSIEKTKSIEFEKPHKKHYNAHIPFAKWPTEGKTYNNVYDVKRKLHVYTKTNKSKCYHAAGYFKIKMNDVWQVLFCPKYIFVQRYPYHGPYNTLEEANSA